MPSYVVSEDCFGFRGRYWNKGEKVELEEGEKPPRQFKPVKPVAHLEPEQQDGKPKGRKAKGE